MTNILSMLMNPTDVFNALEKNSTIKQLHIAALSQDNEDAKKMRCLIRALKKNPRVKFLNISENFLTPACFHTLRDVFLRANRIKTLKFYLASSDRLFNEMFLEMQRFYEDIIRKGASLALKTLIVSKGNAMDFKAQIQTESTVLYIGEGRQLADIVFHVERSKLFIENIKSVVIRGRMGESKEFALYMNDFLKECCNLETLMILKTNLGGVMRNSKNVNMLRDLKSTKLRHVNLTQCDLKNALLERIVLALRPLKTIERLIVAENYELDLPSLASQFKAKKVKVVFEED